MRIQNEMGVIAPVNESGPWKWAINQTENPVCALIPKLLTPHIKQEEYPLPDINSLIMNLREAKVMSLIDLEAGFWQGPVEENSANKLLTFLPPGADLSTNGCLLEYLLLQSYSTRQS
jgi:hypothetical protein